MITSAEIGRLHPGDMAFDCNRRVSSMDAEAFVDKGFRGVIRYIGREVMHTYDLSVPEVLGILSAGLALGVVQHVAPDGWKPNKSLGISYANRALMECHDLGLPTGMNIWCDLEGTRANSPDDVVGFCNAWFDIISSCGYVPGLYVGDRAGLTGKELYKRLKFQYYWGAYNLNQDMEPAIRGLCMKQKPAQSSDFIPGYDNQNMDIDKVLTDSFGNSPLWLIPKLGKV